MKEDKSLNFADGMVILAYPKRSLKKSPNMQVSELAGGKGFSNNYIKPQTIIFYFLYMLENKQNCLQMFDMCNCFIIIWLVKFLPVLLGQGPCFIGLFLRLSFCTCAGICMDLEMVFWEKSIVHAYCLQSCRNEVFPQAKTQVIIKSLPCLL